MKGFTFRLNSTEDSKPNHKFIVDIFFSKLISQCNELYIDKKDKIFTVLITNIKVALEEKQKLLTMISELKEQTDKDHSINAIKEEMQRRSIRIGCLQASAASI
jgi:hypothetical protein